jgi:transcriptional regulator with XRE-family HTH domain
MEVRTLWEWRNERGITRRQLAELVGVDAALLSDIEAMVVRGRKFVWHRIAQVLNIEPEQIYEYRLLFLDEPKL